jgi:hypothetical protein
MLEYFCKKSREALDYTIDFNRFLVGREYIIGASAVVTGPGADIEGVELQITRVNYTKNQVAVWLASGEDDVQYTVTVTIDTDQGRRKEQSFLVRTTGTATEAVFVDINGTTVTIGFSQ